MEANKILSSDFLDILFDGRNKEYGAYELRKTYNRRMTTAMLITAAVCALLLVGYIVSASIKPKNAQEEMVGRDIKLEEIKAPEEKKNQPPPPPPPPKPVEPPPKLEMKKFTPPQIVKDNEVKEDEKPPKQEETKDIQIGLKNQEGIKSDVQIAPPKGDEGKGVIATPPPKDETDYNQTFTKVEIESEYPGGSSAWARYLNKSLSYPQDAIDNEIQGTVTVQFIVDKDGNVSDVEAISGPQELRSEAVRVIKKSGQWTPAKQNGRQVKSYKKQPIVFRLEAQ